MGRYILKRNDGAYVAPHGLSNSYTRFLQLARTYATREEAEKDKCGNETITTIEKEVRGNETD